MKRDPWRTVFLKRTGVDVCRYQGWIGGVGYCAETVVTSQPCVGAGH